MSKNFISNSRGLTLLELLVALALLGVVSALIAGVLVSGINSFKSVNKQISLQDEANAIMTRFSNEIFVAVEVIPESAQKIRIQKYGGEWRTLQFEGENAKVGTSAINSNMVEVVSGSSSFTVDAEKGIVRIQLTVKEKDSERDLKLIEEVTYVPVE